MAGKHLWAKRRALGLCGECGQVPSERFSRCHLCREFHAERLRSWWRNGGWRSARNRINKRRRERYASDPKYRQARIDRYHALSEAEREKERERKRPYHRGRDTRAYYWKNRDRMLAKSAEYYQNNKARILSQKRARDLAKKKAA